MGILCECVWLSYKIQYHDTIKEDLYNYVCNQIHLFQFTG